MKLSSVVLASCALMLPALVGCSSDKGQVTDTANAGKLGEVAMQIRLPSGLVINTIDYDITRTGGYLNEGTVNVENSPVVRFQVGKIPAAQGYNLALSAVTTTGIACTSTPIPFGVTAGGTSLVMATLTCGADGTSTVGTDAGNVRVSVDVVEGVQTICPAVDGLTALPLDVNVGSTISLTGYATTSDATFGWASAPASSNSFAAPAAAVTTYLCAAPGAFTLTLSLSRTGCPTATENVPVTCVALPGTPDAGTPDTGAEIDTGTPDTGAEIDTGTPDTGAEIDTGTPDTGTPDTGTGTPDTGTPDTGTPDAGPPGPTACQTCRAANCQLEGVDLVAGCYTAINPDFGADPADPLFLQQCIDIVVCAQANNCAYSAVGGPLGCYCGSNNPDQCATSGPANSPCAPLWLTGSRATSNAEVLGNVSNLQYPSAWAFYVLDCDRQYCNNATTGNCTVPQ